MQLIESKSILAKLMATENLTIEHRKVRTASFDIQNRILTLPILDFELSNVVMDLFNGHEVGHALYTPLDGMMAAREQKVISSILNVVEDARIERKIKFKYPGLRLPFIKAYKELNEKDFFGIAGIDLNSLNFIDRVNLHFKLGASMNIKFDEAERELVDEIGQTETFDEVIDVTKRVIEYMKEKMQEMKQHIQDNHGDLEDDDSEEGDRDEQSYMTSDLSDLDEDDEFKDSYKDSYNDFENEMNSDEKELEEKLRSFTDESYKENESKLFADKNENYTYVNIPKYDVEKGIFDYKDLYKRYRDEGYAIDRESFTKIRRESNKVVSYLVKEFELRKNADQLKRASTAKTGDLNLNKIFSYQFNEDLFKKVTVVPGGKSHGLVMFLDWSGSMSEHISNTMKQLFNLVLFCKKVNIPFEVYCFVEDTIKEKSYKPVPVIGDIYYRGFGLSNILSSRMTAGEFIYACSALTSMCGLSEHSKYGKFPHWLNLGGTPLNEAVIASMDIVPWFQKKYKLQIVNTIFLTDGDGGTLRNRVINKEGEHTSDNKWEKESQYLVIRDPVTKNQEVYNQNEGTPTQFTTCLIKLLKARTNSNVVGFYIISNREMKRKISNFYPKHFNYYAELEKFKKEKALVLKNTGYDEYYVLRSNGLDTEDDAELKVKANATTRGFVSAFSKYTGGKVVNRVILNRFIGLIS
jgi:hypothetical protein